MICIKDDAQIIALNKILFLAKFECDWVDAIEIAGSPIVAELFRDAQQELTKIQEKVLHAGSNVQKDIDDAFIENRSKYLGRIRKFIEHTTNWTTFHKDEKRKYILDLVTPFKISESFLNELLKEGDECHNI